jgi:hypothetical protein
VVWEEEMHLFVLLLNQVDEVKCAVSSFFRSCCCLDGWLLGAKNCWCLSKIFKPYI